MNLYFILLGVLTGIASGMFGVGGGIVMVPIMVLVFKFPQLAANGTSLVAMVLPVGALGIWQYYQNGYIESQHLKWGVLIGLGIFLGTFIGARLASMVPVEILSKMFSLLLVYAAIRMWLAHS